MNLQIECSSAIVCFSYSRYHCVNHPHLCKLAKHVNLLLLCAFGGGLKDHSKLKSEHTKYLLGEEWFITKSESIFTSH